MPNFTKGPWEVVRIPESFTNTKGIYSVENNDSLWWTAIVGAPAESGTIAQSNAHLIASAPDMYEALKSIVDSGEIPYCYTNKLVIKAKQALAKAEGGEPNASTK